MRTRWKMARERKKKDIPESNQKRRKKENIFDIWSTFSSFSEEKKVKLIHFWIDRATLHFFFVVVLSWFCCLWREKINRPRMKRRERGERGKENFTRHHRRQSQSRDSLESNKQHQKHQMMMTMTRNRSDDDDDEEDNAFSSSRVSSVFLFRDHFRVWRRTTIKIPTTTTTETRITER